LGLGFLVGVVRMRVGFVFLVVHLRRHHLDNEPNLWLKIWLDSRLEYEAAEAQIDFLAFLVLKLGPKDPKSLGTWLSNF